MSDEVSLLFYVTSFMAAAYLFSYGVRRKSHFFTIFALLIPVVIGSFRYGVGTDYFNYVQLYNNHAQLSFSEFITENGFGEIVFFAIEKVAYILFDDPRFVFVSSIVLAITFFYLGLKSYKPRYPALVYLLYLMIMFPITFNAVRQGIAISIVFFAMSYIIKKKPGQYAILILLAGLFHVSALLLLPVYALGRFIDRTNDTRAERARLPGLVGYFLRVGVAVAVTSIVCMNAFAIVLSVPGFDKYDMYLIFNEESNNYIFFLKLLIVIILIVFSRYTVFRDNIRQNKLILAFAIIEVVLLTLGFFSPFIKREALYFAPFTLLLLPNLINIVRGKLMKGAVYALVAFYGVAFFTVSYYVLQQADVIPYDYNIRGGSNE